MQLWLIPLLPLAGFAVNGLFGRRLSKPAINAIAVGSVLLSFLWVLKTLSALGVFGGGNPLEQAYIEHYYTWIQSGTAEHRRRFRHRPADRGDADDRHRRRLSDSRLRGRLHGARRRLLPLLRVPESVHVLHAGAGAGRQLPAAVRRLGRRGIVQLPADRLLLHRKVRDRRRQQSVHRKPHRRLRIFAGGVPDRDALRIARFRARCSARCRACRWNRAPAG